MFFGFFNGHDRISRFTTLRNRNDNVSLMNHGISITEFGRIFHFYRRPAQFLHDIFCNQPSMPASTTGDNDDPVCIFELLYMILHTSHRDGSRIRIKASSQTVKYGIGLLEDFLEHEMVITTFFNSCQFEVKFLDKWGYFFVTKVLQYQFIRLDNRQLIVIYVNNFFGIFYDW